MKADFSKFNESKGKLIKWTAPAYRHNTGFWGLGQYGGYDLHVNDDTVMSIVGDELKYAFECNGVMCFSDGDREVSFEIVECPAEIVDALKAKRIALTNEQKKLFAEADAVSNYKVLASYRSQPQLDSYRTKAEYTKAYAAYRESLNKAWSLYKPYDDQATQLMKEFEDYVISVVSLYEN